MFQQNKSHRFKVLRHRFEHLECSTFDVVLEKKNLLDLHIQVNVQQKIRFFRLQIPRYQSAGCSSLKSAVKVFTGHFNVCHLALALSTREQISTLLTLRLHATWDTLRKC